jgi:hypothetical protein
VALFDLVEALGADRAARFWPALPFWPPEPPLARVLAFLRVALAPFAPRPFVLRLLALRLLALRLLALRLFALRPFVLFEREALDLDWGLDCAICSAPQVESGSSRRAASRQRTATSR